MNFISRRRFVRQTLLAAAALHSHGIKALAQAQKKASLLDPLAIRKLAATVGGHVITPDTSEYESARLIFNRAFDLHPALIVRCASAVDVARALDFAQKQELTVAVRGGGHSRAGFSICDNGMVIDISGMKRIEVDARHRVARAQAGSLVGNMDAATSPFSLATPSGGCPNVGMAGFTLGGGEGLLMSMHGAGCDNLLSATIVLPDGRQVEASRDSHPDLFWAIRGGGGNFGVATDFEYRLHPVDKVLAGALIYEPGQISELLHAFVTFCTSAPDEMVLLGELLRAEQGPRFINHVCYFGGRQMGDDLLKTVRAPHRPESDTVREMSYFEAQAEGFRPKPFAHFQSNLFLPKLGQAAIEAITQAANHAPTQFRILLVAFSGAITRVPVTETAFALRQPGLEVDMLAGWSNPAEKPEAVLWVKSLRNSLKPFARGVYVNQLGETSEELVRAAYGENYTRLAQLKQKYDPHNLLRLNQNIKGV